MAKNLVVFKTFLSNVILVRGKFERYVFFCEEGLLVAHDAIDEMKNEITSVFVAQVSKPNRL